MQDEQVFPESVIQKGLKVVRSFYGFHPTFDLMWGMFDSWDGLGYLATDGVIAWRSQDLCEFIKALGGKEIGWAGASRILGRSIGPRLVKPPIASNHKALAKVRCLDTRVVVGEKGFIYLTGSKSEVTAEDFSTIYGAVACVR